MIKKATVLALAALFLLLPVGVMAQDGETPHDAKPPLIKIGDPEAPGQHIDPDAVQEHATLHITEEEHAAAGHEEPQGLPQFDPTSFPSQIFWLVVVFIILYIVFSRKTLPDISKVIETRQNHIQSDLDSAQDLKEEAEKVKEAYETILEEARQKSTGAFSNVEAAIKEKSEASTQEFLKRAAQYIAKTEEEAEKAKTKVIGEIDALAAQVAVQATEQIIGVKVDTKYAQSIVQNLQGKKKAA